jgi:putative SOS response-associated peptidase YedK
MAEVGRKDKAAVCDCDEGWEAIRVCWSVGEMEGQQGGNGVADVYGVTTDPNEVVQPMHDRMPVIIPERDYDRWLDVSDTQRLPIDLLRPYEADKMTAWKVDKAVGNVKNDSPELIDPARQVLESPSPDRLLFDR